MIRRRAQILITGVGQLGTAVVAELDAQNGGSTRNYVLKTKEMLDVTDFSAVRTQLELLKPDIIINTTGIVDWHVANRNQPKTWATMVQGTDNLAKLGVFLNIPLIHLSCHSVFGMGLQPSTHVYTETDPVSPPNFLAAAQVFAEHAIMRLGQSGADWKYWVFRCGPLFSPPSARQWRADLTQAVLAPPRTSAMPSHLLANDLRITPTYVPHLAKVLVWVAENRAVVPSGIYHAANEGVTTPYDFACYLRRAIDWQGHVFEPAPLSEISRLMGDKPEDVVRSTPLSCEKLLSLTPIIMPSWIAATNEFANTLLSV